MIRADIQPAFLPKKEAAKYLHVGIRKLDEFPELPRYRYPSKGKGSGRVLFKRSDLDQFMEQFRLSPVTEKQLNELTKNILKDFKLSDLDRISGGVK